MAEETESEESEERVEEAQAEEPEAEPAPGEVPAPEGPAVNLRATMIAVLASLVTALLTYGGTSALLTMAETSRAEAARAEFDARIATADARVADLQAQLERLHQQQAVYVAHTSVVRAMQELDRSNFGSASELVKHAGEALSAADPQATHDVQQIIRETRIEVGEDRISQLDHLRGIAKRLQEAMGS